MPEKTMVEAIRDAMFEEMKRDERIILMGEDVGEGGVFRASEGFVAEFGYERCMDTPLAESCIVGAAIGAPRPARSAGSGSARRSRASRRPASRRGAPRPATRPARGRRRRANRRRGAAPGRAAARPARATGRRRLSRPARYARGPAFPSRNGVHPRDQAGFRNGTDRLGRPATGSPCRLGSSCRWQCVSTHTAEPSGRARRGRGAFVEARE